MLQEPIGRNHPVLGITNTTVNEIIAAGVDNLLPYVSDPLVVAEVADFRMAREANPSLHATRCILFSILSPNTRFNANVVAFERLMAIWPTAEAGEIETAIYGAQYHKGKAANVAKLADVDMLSLMQGKESIKALQGMGEKTASFAMALYDDMSSVFTLDLHMLRVILWAAGLQYKVNPLIKPAAYRRLEVHMLEWCQKNDILSPFVAQWSIWNAWGFNRHVSHLAIIGRV